MRGSIVFTFIGVCIAALWYQSMPPMAGGLPPEDAAIIARQSVEAQSFAVVTPTPGHGSFRHAR